MIEANERDFMIVLIDLEASIENNDVELATSVCESLSTMELDEMMTSRVSRTVFRSLQKNELEKVDVYRLLLTNIDFIEDRKYHLNELEAKVLVRNDNADEILAYLESVVNDQLSFNGTIDQRSYASILIRMCAVTKRYDLMDIIRAKLLETEVV